ncbi:hypothetical protein BFDFBN_BFDFBN_14490, partial [Dysosmobacter welbionis]
SLPDCPRLRRLCGYCTTERRRVQRISGDNVQGRGFRRAPAPHLDRFSTSSTNRHTRWTEAISIRS